MPNAPVPTAVDVSELSSTPQSAQSQPSLQDFMAAPDAKAVSVDLSELTDAHGNPTLGQFLAAPEAPATAQPAQPQPEQPLFQKHPANLEYKNIRERESSDKIAARQSAAKDVSRGTEIAGDVLSTAGGVASLALPTTALTAAGSTAEIAKDAMGNTVIKSVPNMIETAGKSLAQKGISATIETAKQLESWVAANPTKAAALEYIAHELGIDPFQLASKVVKYGEGIF